jgi:hypothetical protein
MGLRSLAKICPMLHAAATLLAEGRERKSIHREHINLEFLSLKFKQYIYMRMAYVRTAWMHTAYSITFFSTKIASHVRPPHDEIKRLEPQNIPYLKRPNNKMS